MEQFILDFLTIAGAYFTLVYALKYLWAFLRYTKITLELHGLWNERKKS